MLWIYLLSGFSSNEIVIGAGATGSGANTCTIAASAGLYVNGYVASSGSVQGNQLTLYYPGGSIGSDNSLLGQVYFSDPSGYAYPAASIAAYGMYQGTTYGAELRFSTNAYSWGGTKVRMVIDKGGTIFLSGYTTNGTVTTVGGTGQLSVSSDMRIKNNINYVTDTARALEQINNLKPATFCMNDDVKNTVHLGFIAQDVEKHIPLAVDGKKHEHQWEVDASGNAVFDAHGKLVYRVDDKGNKIIRPRGVSDRAIISVQTLAIQELSKKNKVLQSTLDKILVWAYTKGFSLSQ